MTAITPLTTGFHEITPLTTKSERCYNQPPCNNFLVRTFHVCLHQNGDYRDLLKNIFCLNLESDYCGYYLEPYWRRCRFRHCQTSCLVSVHSTRKWNVVFKHQRGWAGNLVSNRIWSLLFLFQTGRFRSGWHFSIMSAVGKLRSKCKSVELWTKLKLLTC